MQVNSPALYVPAPSPKLSPEEKAAEEARTTGVWLLRLITMLFLAFCFLNMAAAGVSLMIGSIWLSKVFTFMVAVDCAVGCLMGMIVSFIPLRR